MGVGSEEERKRERKIERKIEGKKERKQEREKERKKERGRAKDRERDLGSPRAGMPRLAAGRPARPASARLGSANVPCLGSTV